MKRYLQVVTTTDKEVDARRIAEELLRLQLVACVQITSCSSIYRWKGDIESSAEFVMVMKTREDLFPRLEETLTGLHPYEVPEILATEIVAGSRSYLEWLDHELLPQS